MTKMEQERRKIMGIHSIMTYNVNGFITSLLRNGMKNDGTFGAIDDLTITYDGNRLLKVTDDAETLNYNGALDFDDGDDSTNEYHYDGNGALTSDSNRGINNITYDYTHYPSVIARVTKKKTVYNDYTPDGRKLSCRHVSYFPIGYGNYYRISIIDKYIDGLILRNDTTLLWRFNGGYVELNANGTPTSWNYYITDHLGSTRMVVDSNDNVKETINYYPFGSEMKMQDPAQMTGGTSHPFRFTGKELDRMNSLNMYDFGARWYDVAGVPMWTSVDPLAEKYYHVTPYSYCAGDPVNKFDPEGREVHDGLGSYNADNKDLKDLTIELAKQDAPNSIMIVAHGVQNEEGVTTSVNMQTYNQKTKEWEDNYVSTGKDLSNYLSKTDSKVWKEYQAGNIEAKDLKIVLYACGSSEVAKNISSDPQFKDVTFIAPTKDVVYSKKYDNVMVHATKEQSGRTVLDCSKGKGPGEWNTSRNGHYPLLNSTYSGTSNLRPGTAKFEYKKTFF